MPTLSITDPRSPPQLVWLGRRSSRLHKRPDPRAPDSTWYLVHTHSRQEKVVARHIRALQQSYYLPLERYTTVAARKRITAERPMFSGYLFAHLDPQTPSDLRSTPQLRHAIVALHAVKDPKLLVTQLSTLHAVTHHQDLTSIKFLQAQPSYVPGQKIRFQWPSPLKNLEATIIAHYSKQGLIEVNAGILGAAVFQVDLQKHPIQLI